MIMKKIDRHFKTQMPTDDNFCADKDLELQDIFENEFSSDDEDYIVGENTSNGYKTPTLLCPIAIPQDTSPYVRESSKNATLSLSKTCAFELPNKRPRAEENHDINRINSALGRVNLFHELNACSDNSSQSLKRTKTFPKLPLPGLC